MKDEKLPDIISRWPAGVYLHDVAIQLFVQFSNSVDNLAPNFIQTVTVGLYPCSFLQL